MRVLLFHPNYDPKSLSYQRMSGFPLGPLSIATYLNRHGHQASIVDRILYSESLDSVYERYLPDAVGISMISNMTIPDMIVISDYFRAKGIPVIVGGTYASIVPEIILKEGKADYVTIGEGEQIWLNLMDAMENGSDPHAINGIAYRAEDGEIVLTPREDFMDLSLLGPTDFTLLPDIKIYFQPCYCYENMAYLYLSKGCTGNCAFCFNPFFHKCKRRVRPVSDFLDEVEYLVKNHGLETVYFADELWGVTKSEREELYRQMKERNLSFTWGCQTRIGVLKKEDIQEMYDNGCRWVFFGIEAPPGHLAKIANKHLPYDLVAPTLQNCRDVGMIYNISFIFNFPHETEQDLKDTVQYIQSLPTNLLSIHYFAPFEKSALYDQVVREGLYDPPKTLDELRDGALIEKIYSSFSEVPDRDYRVIRSCFLFQDLFSRNPGTKQEKSANFALESLKTMLLNIRTMQFRQWLRGVFYSAKFTVITVSNALFFPRIRRKYGFRFHITR